MKQMTIKSLALLVAAVTPLAQADVAGGQSDDTHIEVGTSVIPFGPHTAGMAGVGVDNGIFGKAAKVDFQGLADSVGSPTNGVYTLSEPIDEDGHDDLGVFHFAQAGSNDVWFGEWSETGDVSDGTHSVFYVGQDADTSIPSTGEQKYTVVGISDNANRGVLDAEGHANFTANFATNELIGTLSDGSGYKVDIGTATINSDATFTGSSGTAELNSSIVASGGDVEGQFFNSQSELAGFVEFGNNSQYDTAFGGEQAPE